MTRVCHNKCFIVQKFNLENECITSCFHKYINTINRMRILTLESGKIDKSEFVFKIFDPNYDPVEEFIFPRSGSNFYYPMWSMKPSTFKIYPRTGYDPFKNIWELR